VIRLAVLALLLCAAPAWAQAPRGELSSPDPARRQAAARRAGETGDAAAVPALLELLRDEQAAVRAEAARALGRLRARDALRELTVLAQADFDPGVREAAAAAVRTIDVRSFAGTLATSDLPPVRPGPPPPPPPPRSRAVFLAGGAVLSALRASESAAALAGAGLRWARADVQLSLSFPALALLGQVRVNLLVGLWLVPYLTASFAVSYNLGEGREPTLSLAGGGGLRLRLVPRLHLYVEVQACKVLVDSEPAGSAVEPRTFSLPVLAGLTLEL